MAASVRVISGSKRPEAAGHRFGPELVCIECGKTWESHQVDPTVCAPQPDFSTPYQPSVKDGL